MHEWKKPRQSGRGFWRCPDGVATRNAARANKPSAEVDGNLMEAISLSSPRTHSPRLWTHRVMIKAKIFNGFYRRSKPKSFNGVIGSGVFIGIDSNSDGGISAVFLPRWPGRIPRPYFVISTYATMGTTDPIRPAQLANSFVTPDYHPADSEGDHRRGIFSRSDSKPCRYSLRLVSG